MNKTTWAILGVLAVVLLGIIAYWNRSGETKGAFCGGIAAIQCPAGFACKLDGGYPDAGGTCVKQ